VGRNPIGFLKKNGEPYVEAHHVMPVSTHQIKSLSASNVITVCATDAQSIGRFGHSPAPPRKPCVSAGREPLRSCRPDTKSYLRMQLVSLLGGSRDGRSTQSALRRCESVDPHGSHGRLEAGRGPGAIGIPSPDPTRSALNRNANELHVP
jgi:hypothetical protein